MSYQIGGVNIAPIAYGSFSGGSGGILTKEFNCTCDWTSSGQYTITTILANTYSGLVPIATLSSQTYNDAVKIISINSSTNTTCNVTVFRLRDSSNNQTIDDNNVDNPFNFVVFGN